MLKIQKTITNTKGERLFFDDIIEQVSFYLTSNDNQFGALNSDGIEIFSPSYDEVAITEYGFYIVRKNNLCGLINPEGTLVIPVKYNYISDSCPDNMVRISLDSKYGFYNLCTNKLIEPKYDSASTFEKGISKVSLNKLYGYINKNGEVIIKIKYTCIYDFTEDVARTQINNLFGYIRRDGFEILPPEYNEVSGFEYGFGFARQNKFNICVDKTGKIIFGLTVQDGIVLSNVKYHEEEYDWCEKYYNFECGLAVIKQNGRFHCNHIQQRIPLVTFYK